MTRSPTRPLGSARCATRRNATARSLAFTSCCCAPLASRSRRRAALSHVRGEELDDLALQAADDALVAMLAKLDDFRGASRFTTWAYKFALLEAGVKARRRAWQEREVVARRRGLAAVADAGRPRGQLETKRAAARDHRLDRRAA